METAEAYNWMKNTKTGNQDTTNSVWRKKAVLEAFAANTQQKIIETHQQNSVSISKKMLAVFYAKAATCFVDKRQPRSEPRSLVRQNSISFVSVIKQCSTNARIPASAENMAAINPNAIYPMELKKFFQPQPQKISWILATQIQVFTATSQQKPCTTTTLSPDTQVKDFLYVTQF